MAGHGLSAAGYHEDEHTPRLVRSLAGRQITFAAAGLANSGELPEMPSCSFTVEPPNAPQLSSHNRRCQCSAVCICLFWALRLQLVQGVSMIAEQPTYGAQHCARALAVHPQRWTSRSRSLAFTTQLASPLGDVMSWSKSTAAQ